MGEINYTILATEINTDPTGRGYNTTTMSDAQLADLVNAVIPATETGIPAADRTVEIAYISKEQAQTAVVAADYSGLIAEKRDLWLALLTLDQIPVKDANIRAQVLEVWAGGTATRTALGALQTRPASRAEIRFGEGTVVSHSDIGKALRG